jgi:hypothetical protein
MTVIAPQVNSMGQATLKIGANNFEASVSKAVFTPTVTVSKFKGINGATTRSATAPEWTLALEYPQDFATATSLSNLLLSGTGTSVIADLYPVVGGPGYRATVLLVPGDIGGAVDATATGSVTLEVSGQPTLITP